MCAIFGVANHPDSSSLTVRGLLSLQHRGQEGAGIMIHNSEPFLLRGSGLVHDVIKTKIPTGKAAIGHCRYSTQGGSSVENIQPFINKCHKGWIGIAHNGNLPDSALIREELMQSGKLLNSNSDSELFIHYLSSCVSAGWKDLWENMKNLAGAFSLLILEPKNMIAIRDPNGYRPLVFGSIGDGWVVSSETTGLDAIGADFIREVKPGEALVFPLDGGVPKSFTVPYKKKFCSFEYIYFSRPDSVIGGRDMYEIRKNLGMALAEEHHVDADVIIPVPDSGVPAAIGYGNKSKIPIEIGLVRSHYQGRSFIMPTPIQRSEVVGRKLRPVKSVVCGKKVVLVDDSIVRGTTSAQVVRMLKQSGAKEVHLRVSSPPVISPCLYGIDMPDAESLVANRGISDLPDLLGADSVGFLSLEKMKLILGEYICSECFS